MKFHHVFTFLHFSWRLVKYLQCAESHRGKASWSLPMSWAPLLNVNCLSSHFLITSVPNDVLWAPLKVFSFILWMVLKIPTVIMHSHICHEWGGNRLCNILDIMQMEDSELLPVKMVFVPVRRVHWCSHERLRVLWRTVWILLVSSTEKTFLTDTYSVCAWLIELLH